MAQKFLSVKDFERYQHYKHRNPPWIKLYNCLLDDYAFSKLPTASKYLYLGLLILCSRHANRVPNDCTWIAHALHMDPKEIDLSPLYRSGLLLASRNHVASVLHENALSEKSREREETEGEKSVLATPVVDLQSKREAKPEIPLPEDWEPKDHHARFALARNLDLKIEAAHFRGRALEQEWVTKDWDRKFSNWMLQEVKFRQQRSAR
jgi:hypothetical protein